MAKVKVSSSEQKLIDQMHEHSEVSKVFLEDGAYLQAALHAITAHYYKNKLLGRNEKDHIKKAVSARLNRLNK